MLNLLHIPVLECRKCSLLNSRFPLIDMLVKQVFKSISTNNGCLLKISFKKVSLEFTNYNLKSTDLLKTRDVD